MIDMKERTDKFLTALDSRFGDRVWFVGLQGSRGRGEATETSDIDMVVILDELRAEDIAAYSAMLDRLPHRELSCGFLGGRGEICAWEPSDLFQLYFDTTPIRGSLAELLPLLDDSAVERAIRIGACNIYHGCVHNMVHGKNEEVLRGLYKGASFVAQAIDRPDILEVVSRKASAMLQRPISVAVVDMTAKPTANPRMEQLMDFGRAHSDIVNIKE